MQEKLENLPTPTPIPNRSLQNHANHAYSTNFTRKQSKTEVFAKINKIIQVYPKKKKTQQWHKNLTKRNPLNKN